MLTGKIQDYWRLPTVEEYEEVLCLEGRMQEAILMKFQAKHITTKLLIKNGRYELQMK